jgi:hypothetical protein
MDFSELFKSKSKTLDFLLLIMNIRQKSRDFSSGTFFPVVFTLFQKSMAGSVFSSGVLYKFTYFKVLMVSEGPQAFHYCRFLASIIQSLHVYTGPAIVSLPAQPYSMYRPVYTVCTGLAILCLLAQPTPPPPLLQLLMDMDSSNIRQHSHIWQKASTFVKKTLGCKCS